MFFVECSSYFEVHEGGCESLPASHLRHAAQRLGMTSESCSDAMTEMPTPPISNVFCRKARNPPARGSEREREREDQKKRERTRESLSVKPLRP